MPAPVNVPGTTSELRGTIVGRDAELTVLDEFLGSGGSPRAFVLTGGPGIGKTTLWEAGVDLARRGARGEEACARLRAGKQLVAERRRLEGEAQLRRAIDFFGSVGATAYVAEPEGLLTATA